MVKAILRGKVASSLAKWFDDFDQQIIYEKPGIALSHLDGLTSKIDAVYPDDLDEEEERINEEFENARISEFDKEYSFPEADVKRVKGALAQNPLEKKKKEVQGRLATYNTACQEYRNAIQGYDTLVQKLEGVAQKDGIKKAIDRQEIFKAIPEVFGAADNYLKSMREISEKKRAMRDAEDLLLCALYSYPDNMADEISRHRKPNKEEAAIFDRLREERVRRIYGL